MGNSTNEFTICEGKSIDSLSDTASQRLFTLFEMLHYTQEIATKLVPTYNNIRLKDLCLTNMPPNTQKTTINVVAWKLKPTYVVLAAVACTVIFLISVQRSDSDYSTRPRYLQISGRPNGQNSTSSRPSNRPKVMKNQTRARKGELKSAVNFSSFPAKVILEWDTFKTPLIPDSSQCGKCEVTHDRKRLEHKDTAAVAIYFRELQKNYPGTNSRRASQLYVWWSMQSPSRTQKTHQGNDSLYILDDYYFNATMSYRRESTFYTMSHNQFHIYRPIEIVQSGKTGVTSNLRELLALKSKSAIWFVSNCRSGSNTKRRLELSQELVDSGLQLDRFGRCFDKKTDYGRSATEFIKTVEKYRFYMSFENALHCPDYITEKFFHNALVMGAVPVAFGGLREDYKTIAPPNSYILVEDFNTTRDLVDYLHYLERNETAYAEYFAWRSLKPKEVYPYESYRYMGFCALCRSLYGIAVNDSRTFAEIYGNDGARYNESVGFDQPMSVKSVGDFWLDGVTEECFGDLRLRGQKLSAAVLSELNMSYYTADNIKP